MPGLNDPNDSAFTDPSQNGYWKWNEQKRRWEPDAAKDPVNSALFGAPDALGLRASQIFADAPGSSLNLGYAGDDRARMAGLLSQLQGQAATGGGAWEQALKQNTAANNNAATAIGQTLGGDAMSAGRAIGNAHAGNEQRAVGQGNLLRAQSQQTAQGQIADILSGQGALDAQSAAGEAAAKQGLLQANRSLESAAGKARGQLVNSAGQAAVGGMSDGGSVPGKPKVFGDDSVNDTVDAKLTPLEIVLPLSVTMRPDAPKAAADFVAAVKSRKPEAYGNTHFAPGGEVPTFGDVDTGGESLQHDPTSNVISVKPVTGPVPTAAQLDPFAPQTQDPSIANGGLLDTKPYASTRDAALGNAQNFMTQYLGGGPSVAPQAMQNATDSTIADAMRSRGPGITQAATEQLQGAAGNAAGIVAGESQRGAASFAEALQKQRAQDIAFATAQQQAAWRNSLMNAGIGLEQQAQLKGLLGSAGQGAVAVGGMFDVEDGPSHSGFSPDRTALETGGDHGPSTGGGTHDSDPGHTYDGDHYAEGGVVGVLARNPSARDSARRRNKRNKYNEVGAEKPDQGSPDEWSDFPQKKATGTQAEHEGPEQFFAGGGPVFDTSIGLPQPGPFAPQPSSMSIPDALAVLGSILKPPGAPGTRGEDLPLSPEQQAERAQLDTAPRHENRIGSTQPEPMIPHRPTTRERPFIAQPAPPPVQPAAVQSAPQRPSGAPSAPKADPYADQLKAGRMKAEADAALATEQAGVLGGLQSSLEQNAIQQKEIQTRAREQAESGLAQIQQARDELKNLDTTVDPGRYWASRGVPGKISAIIGLALGAIGNDNGVNRAAQLLNQQVDRDIDAQKASFELALRKGQSAVDSAQSIYALSRQMTQDDIAANLAAKGTALDLAKNQVDIAAAKAGAPQAKANLAALSAQIAMEKQKADDSLRQRGFDNAIKKQHADAETMRAQADIAAAGNKAANGDKAQAALIANVEQENRTIQEQGQQLKALIKKYGTSGGLTGPGKAEMQQTLTNMATAAAKLRDPNSVARSSEVDAELKNLFQPGILQREETANAAIDTYLKNAAKRRDDAYSVRGLSAPGAQPEQATPSARPTTASAKGKPPLRLSADGKSWEVVR